MKLLLFWAGVLIGYSWGEGWQKGNSTKNFIKFAVWGEAHKYTKTHFITKVDGCVKTLHAKYFGE